MLSAKPQAENAEVVFQACLWLQRMDTLRLVAERGNERFEIIEGRREGFYLRRYVGGQMTQNWLVDDVAMAFECAEDDWGVSRKAWRGPYPGEPMRCQQKA